MTDITHSATVGLVMTSQTLTITPANETFVDTLATDANVSEWCTNRKGLTATVTSVAENRQAMDVMFSGTPTQTGSEPLAITIPGNVLASGKELSAPQCQRQVVHCRYRLR